MLFDSDLLEHIRDVARQGPGNATSEEDHLIGGLLLMHPEFGPLWNDPETDPAKPHEIEGAMVNPFLHIALHLIVGNQIRRGIPAQAKKSYLHLVERGESDHEALHLMMGWYGTLYFESVRKGDSFDEARYLQGLSFL